MPKVTFTPSRFGAEALDRVDRANKVLEEYASQGYRLTLRQLYYQFVARGWCPNNSREYERLGDLVARARVAGLVDWDHIVDRTRGVREQSSWKKPSEILASAIANYQIDPWLDQPNYVEVWVEKDALVGVIARACEPLRVPYLSCRGYLSQSEAYASGNRFGEARAAGQSPVVLHFGDHDPSGVDMTRDIRERLALFSGGPVRVHRVALTMEQVREFDPPPNPAKESDVRYEKYRERYGEECWELDALEPAVLAGLVTDRVKELVDESKWNASMENERRGKLTLEELHARFPAVVAYIREKRAEEYQASPLLCATCGARAMDRGGCRCDVVNRGMQL